MCTPAWSKRADLRFAGIVLRGFKSHRTYFFAVLAEWSKVLALRASVSLDTGGSNPPHGVFICDLSVAFVIMAFRFRIGVYSSLVKEGGLKIRRFSPPWVQIPLHLFFCCVG